MLMNLKSKVSKAKKSMRPIRILQISLVHSLEDKELIKVSQQLDLMNHRKKRTKTKSIMKKLFTLMMKETLTLMMNQKVQKIREVVLSTLRSWIRRY